jgi:hypothetical protein
MCCAARRLCWGPPDGRARNRRPWRRRSTRIVRSDRISPASSQPKPCEMAHNLMLARTSPFLRSVLLFALVRLQYAAKMRTRPYAGRRISYRPGSVFCGPEVIRLSTTRASRAISGVRRPGQLKPRAQKSTRYTLSSTQGTSPSYPES